MSPQVAEALENSMVTSVTVDLTENDEGVKMAKVWWVSVRTNWLTWEHHWNSYQFTSLCIRFPAK